MRKIALTFVFAMTLPALQTATACEFHGGAGFGYGSKWQSYYGSEHSSTYDSGLDSTENLDPATTTLNSTQIEPALQQPERAKPSFSNAAIRASDTAKARLGTTPFQRSIGLGVLDQLLKEAALNSNRQTVR